MPSPFSVSFLVSLDGSGTQDCAHAKHVLYHQPTPPLEIQFYRKVSAGQGRVLSHFLQNTLCKAIKIHQDWVLSPETCP